MIELIVGIVAGGLLSWVITYVYYRKSSVDVPEWAKPIVESLPQNPPSKEKLLELFQAALQRGEVAPDPVLGHVACPECHAPSSEFRHTTFGDDAHTIVVATCPRCGWSEHAEV
jgi:hypothetical protein